MLPPELMDYRHVFDKTTAERFPESRSWDHAIDLKDDFIPKDCKVYPLTVQEQAELDKFLKENLEKGYIRPSIKKMENYDPARITEPSMKERSRMPIHFP